MSEELVNKGWSQMEAMLDEHMPVKRTRPILPIYFIVGLLVVAALAYFMWPAEDQQQSANDTTTTIHAGEKQLTQSAPAHNERFDFTNKKKNKTDKTNTNKVTKQDSKLKTSTPNAFASKVASNTPNKIQYVSHSTTKKAPSKKASMQKELVFPGSKRKNNTSVPAANSTTSSTTKEPIVHTEASIIAALAKNNKANNNIPNNTVTASDVTAPKHTLTSALPNVSLSPFQLTLASPSLPLLTAMRIIETDHAAKNKYRFEAYVQGGYAKDYQEAQIGLNLFASISPRLDFSAGLAYAYGHVNGYTNEDGVSPTNSIYASSLAYSTFLAENDISSANFISSTSTVYLPINLHYALCDKMTLRAGFSPGLQFGQKLDYAPVMTTQDSRNPEIGSNDLTAEDFFYKKSIGVAAVNFGIDFNLTSHLAFGIQYQGFLSNINRSVNYADPSTLETLGAGEVNRQFYDIRETESRPKTFGFRLGYRF